MGEFSLIESPSNETLAVQAQSGCRASFAELVARFQVPLLHFLMQRTGGLQDAEDLTQDVFVRAFRSLRRYEPRWRFSTWLYTIAHRLSLNARRRWRPPIDGRGLDSLSAAEPGPEDLLSAAEESSRLWRSAASVLTPEQLTTLWLFYVEEMPLEEIARVLGRTSGAAKGLLFRGRRKLAESFGSKLGPDGKLEPDGQLAADGIGQAATEQRAIARGTAEPGANEWKSNGVDRRSMGKHGASGADALPVDATLFKMLPPRLAAELYDG